MTKRFQTRIGVRDVELLTAIDRTPLTSGQLKTLSVTFTAPFRDEHNLRRRLRLLKESGLIRSWPYAIACDGRSPHYFRLTRDGFRFLYGADVALPHRRQFEEISHGHHHHTLALADLIVRLATLGHRHGVQIRHFARENSVRLTSGGFTVCPDCAFQLMTTDGRAFNFMVELDNGTERVRTKQDVESIERKLRGYDAHQARFSANDPERYMVLFVTTRTEQRLKHILDLADLVMTNRQRTVFVGGNLTQLLKDDPFTQPLLTDHRGLKRTLIPLTLRSSTASIPTEQACRSVSNVVSSLESPVARSAQTTRQGHSESDQG
ncbi:MAG: replication-relaxation family protein [Planctomycetaceae bacterium]|nr:replication-relaxation family protein [Planctomycetaceae bacterium]